MAKVELNPMFTVFSGRMGNIVFYRINKKLCARSYVIPRNPDTEKQRVNRSLFAEAVKAWQALPEEEKERYNRSASRKGDPCSGYNLFISSYMTGNREKRPVRQIITVPEKASSMPLSSFYSLSSFHEACSFDAPPLPLVYNYNEGHVRSHTVT